jgi:hypothetical protein
LRIYETAGYVVFDREKGVLRKWVSANKKDPGPRSVPREYPFSECEARLSRVDNPMRATFAHSLNIYHPSEKGAVFSTFDFSEKDHALGFWSFLLQFMDKEALLPGYPMLKPFANRTKGVGSPDEWAAFKKLPGFVDPLQVWLGKHQVDPPHALDAFYALYEPRNMALDPDSIGGPHLSRQNIDTQNEVTPLPKKVLRPFICIDSARHNDDRTYGFRLPASSYHSLRHYHLAAWAVFCAGLALFSVSGIAAWPVVGAAVAYYLNYRRQRRSRGIIFDRENGQVILHHGLRFTPLALSFDQCEGRLVKTEHREGFSSYNLYLFHPRTGAVNLSDNAILCLEYLLGYWSFLVQYMDKSAPLPEVKSLEGYAGQDKGLGPWETWGARATQTGFIDPFLEWQKELAGRHHAGSRVRNPGQADDNPTARAADHPSGRVG